MASRWQNPLSRPHRNIQYPGVPPSLCADAEMFAMLMHIYDTKHFLSLRFLPPWTVASNKVNEPNWNQYFYHTLSFITRNWLHLEWQNSFRTKFPFPRFSWTLWNYLRYCRSIRHQKNIVWHRGKYIVSFIIINSMNFTDTSYWYKFSNNIWHSKIFTNIIKFFYTAYRSVFI